MYKTNQNMIQEVHIGIANPPIINNNFNNQLYNMPMISSYEIFVLVPFVCLMLGRFLLTSFILHSLDPKSDLDYNHLSFLISDICGLYFFGIILPSYFMVKKKVVRLFLWNELKNLIN